MAYIKKNWVGSTDPLVGDPGSTPITEAALDHLETQYDEAVEYTDAAIANLPPSEAVWGSITGTIEDQADLTAAFGEIPLAVKNVVEGMLNQGTNITLDWTGSGISREVTINASGGGGGGAVDSVNGQTGVVVLTQDNVADGTTAKQYTATEKTKLSGIATGATANQSDATTNAAIALKANAANAVFTGTVTIPDGALAVADTNGLQAALDGKQATITNSDSITQGATNLFMTSAERTKLTGVATGATANQSDATTNAAIALKANAANPVFTGTVTIPDNALAIADTSGLQPALDAKAPLASPAFTGTPTGITKAHVGLGNVDNTADASKTFTQSQITSLTSDLGLKAPLASPTFTGTVVVPNASFALSKLVIGGTPDGTKYLRDDGVWAPAAGGGGSVAWGAITGTLSGQTDLQAALDAKAPLASPALTGNPTAPNQTAGNNSTRIANTAYVDAAMGVVAAAAQPLDAELTSLAALATSGSVHRTAAGTIAARTLTGSTYIAVTNGDGVAGNPTVAIQSTIPVANGGTGRATGTTAYGLVAVGTTATGAQQTVSPGTSGQVLVSAGAAALPAFGAVAQSAVTNLTSDLALKAPLASPAFTGTPTGITAAHVGLGNVNNTADTAKPVSTAQQTALDLKANLASPTFTGTVAGITKAMVGLGNVDNTADASKTFTQSQITSLTTDLGLKAPLASPTFTGTVVVPDASFTIAKTNGLQAALDAKAPLVSSWKTPVRVATVTTGTLASAFENGDAVDGITLATGDRILIKDQSDPTENGIYTVNASGAPTRATDLDASAEFNGALVNVLLGSVNSATQWIQYAVNPTLGSTPIQWAKPVNDVISASDTVKGKVELATVAETLTGTDPTRATTPEGVKAVADLKAPLASPAFTGTPTGITKAHVGLSNVDNTTDAGKPISTAQMAGLQPVVRWNSVTDTWDARGSVAPWGVRFLSTNDVTATAPTDVNLAVGDIWERHPDAV